MEIVRSSLEPFEGVDVAAVDWGHEGIRDAIGPAYAPDVELRTLASGIGSGMDSVYHGWDGLTRYLEEWFEPFSEYHVEWLDDTLEDARRAIAESE